MHQSSSQLGKTSSIYPYYKPNDVFARDQAYYDQLLNNTRKTQNLGYDAQTSQRVTYQPVQTQYRENRQSQMNIQVSQPVEDTVFMNQSFGPHSSKINEQSNIQQQQINQAAYNLVVNENKNSGNLGYQQDHLKALEQNRKLKQRLDDLINYRDLNDDGSEIVKKHHYNTDSEDGKLISQQEIQIKILLNQIKVNNTDITKFKNAIVELQKSMNNIQSVDREIYRQLKNLSNRDQELLDKATGALARGATRDQVASILERIIS